MELLIIKSLDMDNDTLNQNNLDLFTFETPFADINLSKELENQLDDNMQQLALAEFETPFSNTFESSDSANRGPVADDYISFLSELHDSEFSEALYELAHELEESIFSKVNDVTFMGESFLPFASKQAGEFFHPLINETNIMFDKAGEHFSHGSLGDYTDQDIEKFFEEFHINHPNFSPAQEQFFKKIAKKAKAVVKKGVNAVKKGIKAVGKVLPISGILNRLKALVKPLLERVLKFAIGKLPQSLRPHAQNLAKKILKLEITESEFSGIEEFSPASGDLEYLQFEFDNSVSQLLYAENEHEAESVVVQFEHEGSLIEAEFENEAGIDGVYSIETAKQQFIENLKNLKPGESPQEAIEQFIPVVFALKPAIKIALKIIGRKRVVNFIAGFLSKLISKYVPSNISKPLAASIIDIGMKALGFETVHHADNTIAFEAIANTLEETIENIKPFGIEEFENSEYFASMVLEAFEDAAMNNFPPEYIREELRTTGINGIWIPCPRQGSRHYYKKYSHIFDVTLEHSMAKSITAFNGVPLNNFLKDKYGISLSKPVKAKVHLYESIPGTWLSHISRYERVGGLGGQKYGWVQLHPLTPQAASFLLKEPQLGKYVPDKYLQNPNRIAIGQRFYFLEIPGTRVKLQPVFSLKSITDATSHLPKSGILKPAASSDIQGIIDFQKSLIQFNYYLSEEDAIALVEKLNRNDIVGAFQSIRYSIRRVLHDTLLKNIGTKVKIVHEAIPEMYLGLVPDEIEQFAPVASIGKIAVGSGKSIMINIVEKMIEKLTEIALKAIINFFKARANEFKNAQMEPADGVTLKINWINISGMSGIKTMIDALRGKLSLGSIADLSLPAVELPEIRIISGKHFE